MADFPVRSQCWLRRDPVFCDAGLQGISYPSRVRIIPDATSQTTTDWRCTRLGGNSNHHLTFCENTLRYFWNRCKGTKHAPLHVALKSYKRWLWTSTMHQYFELQSSLRQRWSITESKASRPISLLPTLALRSPKHPSSPMVAILASLFIMYVVYDGYPLPKLMTYHIKAPDVQRPRFSWPCHYRDRQTV